MMCRGEGESTPHTSHTFHTNRCERKAIPPITRANERRDRQRNHAPLFKPLRRYESDRNIHAFPRSASGIPLRQRDFSFLRFFLANLQRERGNTWP